MCVGFVVHWYEFQSLVETTIHADKHHFVQTYSAFMWLLSSVAPHVYNQHVLGFKGFFLSGAAIPVACEVLTVLLDVVTVDMFDKIVL